MKASEMTEEGTINSGKLTPMFWLRWKLIRLISGKIPVAINLEIEGYILIKPLQGIIIVDHCSFTNAGGACIKIKGEI